MEKDEESAAHGRGLKKIAWIFETFQCDKTVTEDVTEASPEPFIIECRSREGGRFPVEILRVEHLTKSYGSGETEVKALNDVSFSVRRGEFVAIVGASGSGKSTLLHLLGGVDRPTSGKVFVGGTDLYEMNESQLAVFRRRQIGLIYQFYNLIPVLNVQENITLPLLLDGRKVNHQQLTEILDTLSLQNRLRHLPNQLSGGQQQRVSIGRALINNPALVLADEPTGNLDSKNSAEIMELLKMSNRKYDQTLLVITHDEDIALQADRVMVIEDGRLVKDEVIRK
jgi:putative ABC transport system ATP-binding protein